MRTCAPSPLFDRVQDRIGRPLRPMSLSQAIVASDPAIEAAHHEYRRACACADPLQTVTAIHRLCDAISASNPRYREWAEYQPYNRDASAGGSGAPLIYARNLEVNRYNGRANVDCPLPFAISQWGKALTHGNSTDNAEASSALGAAPTITVSSPFTAGEGGAFAFGLLFQFSIGSDQSANNVQIVVSFPPWYGGPTNEIDIPGGLASITRVINLKLPAGGSSLILLFSELIGSLARLGVAQGTAREMPVISALSLAVAGPPVVELREITCAFSNDPTQSQARVVALTRGNADAEQAFLHVVGPRMTVMVPA